MKHNSTTLIEKDKLIQEQAEKIKALQEKLLKSQMVTNCNNTTNNTTNNVQNINNVTNNIVVNAFGSENVTHLSNVVKQLVSMSVCKDQPERLFLEVASNIWVHPKFPENHNVKYTNTRSPFIAIAKKENEKTHYDKIHKDDGIPLIFDRFLAYLRKEETGENERILNQCFRMFQMPRTLPREITDEDVKLGLARCLQRDNNELIERKKIVKKNQKKTGEKFLTRVYNQGKRFT
tara:strand:+ start:173 stop:874 length:702 start_codon:yes stop_codon:yes gene_type:complete